MELEDDASALTPNVGDLVEAHVLILPPSPIGDAIRTHADVRVGKTGARKHPWREEPSEYTNVEGYSQRDYQRRDRDEERESAEKRRRGANRRVGENDLKRGLFARKPSCIDKPLGVRARSNEDVESTRAVADWSHARGMS